MLQSLINPIPLIFTITATFGVLIHDTQLDRATTVALAVPTAFASFLAIDQVMKSSEQHVHVERVASPAHITALRATLPRIQPRDDDRRYTQSKRIQFSTGEAIYLWPSV